METTSLTHLFEAANTLRWLYVDFNSYFASVEQQLRPELRGKPVAVVPVETDSTSAIAASYEAKAFGIKTGTPVWEAKQRCPGLICVLANHEHYTSFHQRIKDEVNRHIPIDVVASIDEVACRLMDNETSIARATEIAHSIKRGLAENIGEYVRCSIGIAPNRYLAKIATDMQKPDGLVVMQAQDLPEKLFTLKLSDLPGVGRNMEVRLHRAGIFSVRDLWQKDARQMRKIWGSIWGERLWYFLRGVELPDLETERHSIGHSHVLAPELRIPTQTKYVARRLMLKAASRLRRMEYYAEHVSLSIRLENGVRLATERHCYRAQDSRTFLLLLDEMWDELMQHAGKHATIRKTSVVLSRLLEARSLQDELFPGLDETQLKQRARNERMSHAMDKLNHRYGRDTVLIGMTPSQGRSFSGTKIAFTRIPDIEEFNE
jgi:DNA polymerase-4